jgi:hypothetical protein
MMIVLNPGEAGFVSLKTIISYENKDSWFHFIILCIDTRFYTGMDVFA